MEAGNRILSGNISGHAGYFVSTVGHDEEAVRRYIREQEAADRRLEQLELFKQKRKRPLGGPMV